MSKMKGVLLALQRASGALPYTFNAEDMRGALKLARTLGADRKDVRQAVTTLSDDSVLKRIRARALGFDSDRAEPWWKGSHAFGHTRFEVGRILKHHDTGVWMGDDFDNAATYTNVRDPVIVRYPTVQELARMAPDEIERLTGTAFQIDDLQRARSLSGFQPDLPFSSLPSDAFSVRHTGWNGDLIHQRLPDQDALEAYLSDAFGLSFSDGRLYPDGSNGVYPLYVRAPQRAIFDFEGENWAEYPERQQGYWVKWPEDEGRGNHSFHYDLGDAQDTLAELLDVDPDAIVKAAGPSGDDGWGLLFDPNGPPEIDSHKFHIVPGSDVSNWQTTDDLAREARAIGADAAEMRDVEDFGGGGGGWRPPQTTLAVMDPRRVRHAFDAEYDPLRLEQNDILAGLTGIGAPLGVLAILRQRQRERA